MLDTDRNVGDTDVVGTLWEVRDVVAFWFPAQISARLAGRAAVHFDDVAVAVQGST